jgi:hypothetical protein
MYRRISSIFGAVALMATLGFAGEANSTPVFDDFGLLTPATFGGTGIPNDNVAITTITDANTNTIITLGLSATQRFSNPALTNDGAGTFFAGAGSNFGGAGESSFEGALWNFDFFIDFDSSLPPADFDFKLLYDFDPTSGTIDGDLGILDLNGAFPSSVPVEGSQNLLFSFLASNLLSFISPPSGSFDPNAAGEYSFALIVSDANGGELGRSAIDVNVGVVPLPAALPLYGTGLALMGFVGWRRRKAATA